MSHFAIQNGPFRSMKWLILASRTGRFEVQNGSFWKKKTRKRFFRVNFSVKKEKSFFWNEKKSIHDFNVIFSYTFTLSITVKDKTSPKRRPTRFTSVQLQVREQAPSRLTLYRNKPATIQ
ncbi:MAG: hypothetical protein II612_02890 [Prevotella sp.]|nr:hypothetical protein [Prevotella sp.]